MSSKAYLRRASINEAQLMSEMKSWGKNKAMDRTLIQRNEKMDKYLANRRKTQQYEKDLLSKDLEKNVLKTSVTTDEYLDRSQSKYSTWKERERERLERRYTSLNKAYMKEYKELGLHNYEPSVDRKHRRKSESDVNKEGTEVVSEAAPDAQPPQTSREILCEPNTGGNDEVNKDSVNDIESKSIEAEADREKEEDTVVDISVRNLLMRQNRRATVTNIPKRDRPLASNVKFDRRPSMPFSAIPYNFGK